MLLSVAWGGGNWVVVGAGIFYRNAGQWTLSSDLEFDYYYDVAYGDGYWVTVGPSGKIKIAGPVVQLHSPTITPGNGITWKLSGPSGWYYQVQSTTNLSNPNWLAVTNFTSTNETTVLSLGATTNEVPHFFRTESP